MHFHRVAKEAVEPFGTEYYQQYKAACDSYFYLPHRDETRGIGGLFFDDFNELGFEQSFAFMQSVGNAFYLLIYQLFVVVRVLPTASENGSSNYTGAGDMLSLISFMIAVLCLDYKAVVGRVDLNVDASVGSVGIWLCPSA